MRIFANLLCIYIVNFIIPINSDEIIEKYCPCLIIWRNTNSYSFFCHFNGVTSLYTILTKYILEYALKM